jgi:fructosamine-3-kinase
VVGWGTLPRVMPTLLDDDMRHALARVLGSPPAQVRPLHGGDINQAARVDLADGRAVFVKSNPGAPDGLFEAEASGLAWLAEAKALRVPAVLGTGEPGGPRFLALEYLEPGRPAPDLDQQLGTGLAALHRFGARRFGLEHDNFIGKLPQSNTARDEWSDFYRSERLEPQLERAHAVGLSSSTMRRGFERLFARWPEPCGAPEPPARLHGDLWSGNLFVAQGGAPVLIDPAAYAGSREIDLAMMRLFGGFSARTFAAYSEAFPLSPGHEQRVALYQLYPLLVHVNHFGGAYVGAVERTLAQIV